MIGPGDRLAEEGAAVVRERIQEPPSAAIILGSGLGEAVSAMEAEADLPYTELPGFPVPTAPGHAGRLRIGTLAGERVAAFLGRVHYYEGHPMDLVTLPTRLAAALGARTIIVTAAVGGLDPEHRPGDLVVCVDHINLLGVNPLRGWKQDDGTPAFVNLTEAYDRASRDVALQALEAEGLPASTAVYASLPGPTYETPAEVEHVRRIGATVVGMSVVPEVTAAAALGLRCLTICCVTNEVGGDVGHTEVNEVATAASGTLGNVLARVLPAL